jgi:uncharacterized protein YjaG (DUF416 family)
MQIYLNFIDEIEQLIFKASKKVKIAFALDCCKSLFPDYKKFAETDKTANPTLLFEIISDCEKALIGKVERLDEYIDTVQQLILEEDETTDWQTVYAMNAAKSVLEMLLYIKDSDEIHMTEISSLMIDTLDYKIAAQNPSISDEGIFSHQMMKEEMQRLKDKLKLKL